MSVALGIQHAKRIIFLSVACLALPYFFTLSYKRNSFRGKSVIELKCEFWFSVQIFFEIFLILRRIKRDAIINVCLIFSDINKSWICSTDFWKNSNVKFHGNLPSGSRVVPLGRTDRHNEANMRFSQFWKFAEYEYCILQLRVYYFP